MCRALGNECKVLHLKVSLSLAVVGEEDQHQAVEEAEAPAEEAGAEEEGEEGVAEEAAVELVEAAAGEVVQARTALLLVANRLVHRRLSRLTTLMKVSYASRFLIQLHSNLMPQNSSTSVSSLYANHPLDQHLQCNPLHRVRGQTINFHRHHLPGETLVQIQTQPHRSATVMSLPRNEPCRRNRTTRVAPSGRVATKGPVNSLNGWTRRLRALRPARRSLQSVHCLIPRYAIDQPQAFLLNVLRSTAMVPRRSHGSASAS